MNCKEFERSGRGLIEMPFLHLPEWTEEIYEKSESVYNRFSGSVSMP